MKSVYPLLLTAFACLTLAVPRMAVAQCTCSGGTAATPITQLVTIDTSTASNYYLTFNKWQDTSTNTPHEALTCMTIQDTISVVSSTTAQNTSASGVNSAFFISTSTITLTGPGLSGSPLVATSTNGPYNFGASGTPTDAVSIGPDTLFNKNANSVTPSNVAPYQGTGTVTDTLTFGGGASSTAGTNFNYSISTKYWGSARVTYYWCPAIALATSLIDFTATPTNNYIILAWTNTNEQINTLYEIQVSTDGQNFTNAGETESNAASAGTAAKYQYQYNLNQTNVGRLYFRIQEKDPDGKLTYSDILIVSPNGESAGISYHTYPNPATNSLVFQFNSAQTGRYLLELISTSGQVVQQETATLTGSSQIQLDLNPHPAKGLYFLRTTDLTHNQNYLSKVLIN
jgi:hypothetical protein